MVDQWNFTIEELQHVPSVASGAMDVAEERKQRIYGCTFIQAAGCRLELPQLTISTAMVYFHRFFSRESFSNHRYEHIAATCIYLACKVEESSRRPSDVAEACLQHRPSSRSNHNDNNPKVQRWRRAILSNEHLLLDILCFDFTVEHPYQSLFQFAEELGTSENTLQAAWAFVNDSLRLILCLLYEPHLIAAGCLLLAYRLNNKQLPVDGDFGKMMEDNYEALQDIVKNIMNSYKIVNTIGTSPHHHRNSSTRQVGTRRSIHSTISQPSSNTLILDAVQ